MDMIVSRPLILREEFAISYVMRIIMVYAG